MRKVALLLIAVLAGPAFPQDAAARDGTSPAGGAPAGAQRPANAAADAVATIRTELAAYDATMESGGGADTIPAERAILGAGATAPADALLPFVGHRRFGPLVFSTICAARSARPRTTAGADPVESKLLEAFRAFDPERQAETARALAALASDAVRAALREAASIDAFVADGPPKEALRAALVRAGDPAAVADLRTALASKDADAVARALLLAGEARAPDAFLAEAARLADDARKLATPVPSQWPDVEVTKSDDGLTTTSRSVAVTLRTVGDAAVEAANRMFATTLPEWTAWWYELEKGARFGRGAEAVRRVRAFAAADAKAVAAKAVRASAAVAAVQRALRSKAEDGASWTLVSVTFDKAWTVAYTLEGTAGTAVVDAGGAVTLR